LCWNITAFLLRKLTRWSQLHLLFFLLYTDPKIWEIYDKLFHVPSCIILVPYKGVNFYWVKTHV
jgi:hypothetical protein